MLIKKIGVLYHPLNGEARTMAGQLETFLAGRGVVVWSCSAWEGEQINAGINGTDLLVTIGGDGTILRAAQAAMAGETAIVGINMGKLGFMTELAADGVEDTLDRFLAGEGWLDERATLEARYGGNTYYALNDVVVARGSAARTISIEVRINGERLTGYRADGVVVATATGSTGYALAAGGPILHPRASEFVLIPVVPHIDPGYPVVLPSDAVVGLVITTAQEATLSIDGYINLPLSGNDSVEVRLGSRKARFLRIHPEKFYGTLEQRLKGKR
jgi:NAD+ kinase